MTLDLGEETRPVRREPAAGAHFWGTRAPSRGVLREHGPGGGEEHDSEGAEDE